MLDAPAVEVSLELIVAWVLCIRYRVRGHNRDTDPELVSLRDHLSENVRSPVKLMIPQADGVVPHRLHDLELRRMTGREQLEQRPRHPVSRIVEHHWVGRRPAYLIDERLRAREPADGTVIARRARAVLRVRPPSEHVALPVVGVEDRDPWSGHYREARTRRTRPPWVVHRKRKEEP